MTNTFTKPYEEAPNELLRTNYGHVSYNEALGETAVVARDINPHVRPTYYVLEGDFRKSFKGLSLNRALKLYEALKNYHSPWTTQ